MKAPAAYTLYGPTWNMRPPVRGKYRVRSRGDFSFGGGGALPTRNREQRGQRLEALRGTLGIVRNSRKQARALGWVRQSTLVPLKPHESGEPVRSTRVVACCTLHPPHQHLGRTLVAVERPSRQVSATRRRHRVHATKHPSEARQERTKEGRRRIQEERRKNKSATTSDQP